MSYNTKNECDAIAVMRNGNKIPTNYRYIGFTQSSFHVGDEEQFLERRDDKDGTEIPAPIENNVERKNVFVEDENRDKNEDPVTLRENYIKRW